MPLFKRCYKLSIDIGNIRKTYQELSGDDVSLKIDFDVDMSVNGSFSKGNITIIGLPQNDIALLSTNRNKDGTLKPSKLSLEVGYLNILGQILQGNIIEAEANFTAPDQSIRLGVMSAYESGQTQTSASLAKNATFRDIAQAVASANKLTLKYDLSIPNKVIGDYSFRGTPFQQVQRLREYMPDDVDIAIRNDILEVKNKKAPASARKIKIDSDSGLIGDPAPTLQGCNIRTLLNPALKVNDYVELKSARIPQLNGLYRIIELKHRGTNRGDLWESALVLNKV